MLHPAVILLDLSMPIVDGLGLLHDVGIGLALSSAKNGVRFSVSLGNSLDLADLNPTCDGNVWTSDMFGTSNQPCIH